MKLRDLTSLACRLLSASVGVGFGLAAIGKVGWPENTERVLPIAGFASWLVSGTITLVPGIEAALAIALVLGWRSKVLYPFAVAVLLVFSAFLFWLGTLDPTVRCSCFGPLVTDWTDGGARSAIVRNFVLLIMLIPSWCSLRNAGHVDEGGDTC